MNVHIKEGHPSLHEIASRALASGDKVWVEHRCPNCLGRGWFGRKEAPWAHRHCDDCAGLGWITRGYVPNPEAKP